ncbi:unnamed protein product, partial [Ixodes persulcatus]
SRCVPSDLHPTGYERCAPKKNIVFLKLHKCAGSSVFNLLMRQAEERNLLLALPNANNHLLGYPRLFNPRIDLLDYRHCGGKPNLLTYHMRFNETAVREVMPEDSVYVTIMRDPTDLFASMFYYFKLDAVYDVNLSQFLREPFFLEIIRKSRLHNSMGFNQMTFDLGFEADDERTERAIPALIQAVDRRFHLVMIAERFVESLVLLGRLLCWDTDALVTLRHNVRSDGRRHELDDNGVATLRRSNRVDEALYRYFYRKFDEIVEEFGRDKMQNEAAILEGRIHAWHWKCVDEYRVRQPSDVYEYIGRTRNLSVQEGETCRKLLLPEQVFAAE